MSQEIQIQVTRGTKIKVVEVDEVKGGYDAAIVTGDDKKLKINVKRLAGSPGVSSKVVDVLMCG